MHPEDIKEKTTYASNRWQGDRLVTEIRRHRGQDPVVHYVDQRTSRTGNAPLPQFAASADNVVSPS
jgi:hypothetical protein